MQTGISALVLSGLFCLAAQPALAQSAAPSTSPPGKTGEIVVEPTVNRPKPPDGDPRTNEQRLEDRTAFDKCMLKMQGRPEDSLSNPGLPPDATMYCRQRLGMQNAYDVPQQTRARQR